MKRCKHCHGGDLSNVHVVIVPSARLTEALRDDLAAARAMHLADALYLEKLRNAVASAVAAAGAEPPAQLVDLVHAVNAILTERADALGLPSLRAS